MKKLLKKSLVVSFIIACFVMLCGFDENEKKVYDNANLMSEKDVDALNEKCVEVSKYIDIDIAIVTIDNAEGKTTQKYAQDFYVNHNLGYEDDGRFDKSSIVFVIDLDNRETYISTTGLGILFVEDHDIDSILDEVYKYIKTDYYLACSAFLDKTETVVENNKDDYGDEYLEDWKDFRGTYAQFFDKYVKDSNNVHGNNVTDEQRKNNSIFYRLKNPVNCILIALVVGGVSVAIMAYSNKAKMSANGNTYMDKDKFNIHHRSDFYIKTTVQKNKIRSESSGGHSGGHGHGGSFHSGSGGHSFGGGGRKL